MGKSSKDKRDAYYRLAKEQNWRARSAFKLIQIDEQFDLFAHSNPDSVTRVVDLCAAPGSWSQVLSRVLIKGESFGRRAWVEQRRRERRELRRQESEAAAAKAAEGTDSNVRGENDSENEEEVDDGQLQPRKDVKIVSIDLQPMAPLEGITTLKADITHPSTIPLLLRALDPEDYDSNATAKATTASDPQSQTRSTSSPFAKHRHAVDLVISDGAPDVTGLHDLDIYIQSQLLYSALNLAMGVLRPGGKFVAKIFRGRDVDLIYAQLKTVFEKVSVAKPRSSRASSVEAFVVCEGFIPPPTREGVNPLENPLFGGGGTGHDAVTERQEDEKTEAGEGQTSQPTRTAVPDRPHATVELRFPSTKAPTSKWIAPFIACGDLSAWDADASYALPEGHVSLDPVQPPTAPPYKRALEMRKERGGAYGKTKGMVPSAPP